MKAALSVLLVVVALAGVYGQTCLNVDGLMMIKSFEGFRAKRYQDSEGIWTIGYGTLCSTGTLKCPGPVTEAAAAAELSRAIASKFGPCVRSTVKAALNNNQYSALVSFAYNVGCGALTNVVSSTGGKLSGFPARMKLYNKARVNGVLTMSQDLVRRRNAEAALFESKKASGCATQNGGAPTAGGVDPFNSASIPPVFNGANAGAALGTPSLGFPVHPPVNFASPILPPSTQGRVLAEGEDTGKVNWVKDTPQTKRKLKMGGLNKKKGLKATALKKKRAGSTAQKV